MTAVDGPQGIFADEMPVPTGGAMIKRTPNDPAWYKGGLWHDNMKVNIPGFYFMSWYDVSTGPNLAMYNHIRKTASKEIADKQYAVIAPTLHCSYTRATENTVVGQRSMGDARLDYSKMTYDWFDHFLKGEQNDVLKRPKVQYFTMGSNKWQVVRIVATGRCAADEVLSFERRQGEHRSWRRQTRFGTARDRLA